MKSINSVKGQSDLDIQNTSDDEADVLISVITPAYNEEKNIDKHYSELSEVLDPLYESWEVLYVDDGSSDETYDVLTELVNQTENVRAIKFWQNFGKANALSAAFDNAKGDIIVTMDADLQDDPSEIPDLIDKLDSGYDLISGWRYDRQSPFLKRKSSSLYNKLTSKLTGVELHDLNCGLKVYRREVVESIDVYGGFHRYIPVLAHWHGFRVGEMKVSHRERRHGQSKYSIGRLSNGFFDLLSVTFLSKYSRSPLRVFGGIGTIVTSLGFFAGLYLLYVKYILGRGIGNRPLLFLSVLLIVIGIQLFVLGFISEKINYGNHITPHYETISDE